MKIGLMRAEEAKVMDSMAGYHRFISSDGIEYGSFEVFWYDSDGEPVKPGWYWWACFPGCIPDGEPMGPFSTSINAYYNAMGDDYD